MRRLPAPFFHLIVALYCLIRDRPFESQGTFFPLITVSLPSIPSCHKSLILGPNMSGQLSNGNISSYGKYPHTDAHLCRDVWHLPQRPTEGSTHRDTEGGGPRFSDSKVGHMVSPQAFLCYFWMKVGKNIQSGSLLGFEENGIVYINLGPTVKILALQVTWFLGIFYIDVSLSVSACTKRKHYFLEVFKNSLHL